MPITLRWRPSEKVNAVVLDFVMNAPWFSWTQWVAPVLIVNLADGDRIVTGTELMTWLMHMAAHSVPGGMSPSD
jgi:hypothetical protein